MSLPRPAIRADGPPDIPGMLRITAAFDDIQLPGRGRYTVEVELGEHFGTWECVGLTVRSPERGRRVDGDILRRLRVADLVRASAAEFEDCGLADEITGRMVPPPLSPSLPYVDRWSGEVVPAPMTAAEQASAAARREEERLAPAKQEAARFRRMVREAARAGGRTRLDAAAAIYKRAMRKPGATPTKAVQKELGISYDAAVGLVRRARYDGLLPPTTPGVASASPPPDERKRTK